MNHPILKSILCAEGAIKIFTVLGEVMRRYLYLLLVIVFACSAWYYNASNKDIENEKIISKDVQAEDNSKKIPLDKNADEHIVRFKNIAQNRYGLEISEPEYCKTTDGTDTCITFRLYKEGQTGNVYFVKALNDELVAIVIECDNIEVAGITLDSVLKAMEISNEEYDYVVNQFISCKKVSHYCKSIGRTVNIEGRVYNTEKGKMYVIPFFSS